MFSYLLSQKGDNVPKSGLWGGVIFLIRNKSVAFVPISSPEEGEKLGREWVNREFAQLRYGGERAGSLMRARRGVVASKDRHNGQD